MTVALRGGENFNAHTPPPVRVAAIKLDDINIEEEARAAAAKVAERRIIRAGRDAWHEIGRAESFEAWCRIGAALALGKAYALKATGANAAWGRNYSLAFSAWMKECGFGRQIGAMPSSFMKISRQSSNGGQCCLTVNAVASLVHKPTSSAGVKRPGTATASVQQI